MSSSDDENRVHTPTFAASWKREDDTLAPSLALNAEHELFLLRADNNNNNKKQSLGDKAFIGDNLSVISDRESSSRGSSSRASRASSTKSEDNVYGGTKATAAVKLVEAKDWAVEKNKWQQELNELEKRLKKASSDSVITPSAIRSASLLAANPSMPTYTSRYAATTNAASSAGEISSSTLEQSLNGNSSSDASADRTLLRERRDLEAIIARYETVPVADRLREQEEQDELEGGAYSMPSPSSSIVATAAKPTSSSSSQQPATVAAASSSDHEGRKYRRQESDTIFGLEQELLVAVKALSNEKNDRMSQQRMYEARLARLTEDYDALQYKLEKVQSLNIKFETAGIGLEKQSHEMASKYDEVLRQYELQEARVSVQERQLRETKQELHDQEQQNSTLLEKVKRLEKHNQELRELKKKEVFSFEGTIDSLRGQVKILSAEKTQLENALHTQQPRQLELIESLKAELERYREEEAKQNANGTLGSTIVPSQTEIRYKLQLSKKQSEVDALTVQVTSLATSTGELQRQNLKLKQKLYNVLTGVDDDISELDLSVLEGLQEYELSKDHKSSSSSSSTQQQQQQESLQARSNLSGLGVGVMNDSVNGSYSGANLLVARQRSLIQDLQRQLESKERAVSEYKALTDGDAKLIARLRQSEQDLYKQIQEMEDSRKDDLVLRNEIQKLTSQSAQQGFTHTHNDNNNTTALHQEFPLNRTLFGDSDDEDEREESGLDALEGLSRGRTTGSNNNNQAERRRMRARLETKFRQRVLSTLGTEHKRGEDFSELLRVLVEAEAAATRVRIRDLRARVLKQRLKKVALHDIVNDLPPQPTMATQSSSGHPFPSSISSAPPQVSPRKADMTLKARKVNAKPLPVRRSRTTTDKPSSSSSSSSSSNAAAAAASRPSVRPTSARHAAAKKKNKKSASLKASNSARRVSSAASGPKKIKKKVSSKKKKDKLIKATYGVSQQRITKTTTKSKPPVFR